MDFQILRIKLSVGMMFLFGNSKDIYNLWSIINLLDKKQLGTYWANTSANGLIAKLIQ